MSTVVAVSVPALQPEHVDTSAARKRRREILASQRQTMEASMTACPAVLATPVSSDDEATLAPVRKFRRVSDFDDVLSVVPSVVVSAPVAIDRSVGSKKSSYKKPQMKYDPDVPMTKEEAAVWRREQRRKRNRESAALSRQRQRDRIADLEVEVADWKLKVDSIMDRIKKLEEASGIDSRTLVPPVPFAPDVADLDLAGLAADLEAATAAAAATVASGPYSSQFVSPPVSPGHSSFVSSSPAEASPISSADIQSVANAVVDQVLGGGVFEQEHSDKMISRHAAS
ncbi:bZIP transcription factor [Nitzschia inconspicua]|uniref:BZIP transcription factor n=1 Tax=Nitzschia inconspicua TaxID=303405 RepID=A0A9K3PQJ1_9STRA|nr:bZIP transcription factor [Nitzschia inconspicua]